MCSWDSRRTIGPMIPSGVQISTWSGPMYLCDELRRPADTEARRRLRSASSATQDVRPTRLSTVGDTEFPASAARLWNSLPSHVTTALSLSLSPCSALVLNHISFHFLIPLSDSSRISTVAAQWLVIPDTIIAFTFNIIKRKYGNIWM